MKNVKLRLLSLLLTVVMTVGVFAVIPVNALGEQTRTVMLYLIGSDLEEVDGSATWNLVQAMSADYDENLDFIVMTGGSRRWKTGSEYLDGVTAIDPTYNQIWKLEGKRDGESHGVMKLLEPTGIAGFETANMSTPETLTAFIDYCYENYPADQYDLILWDHGGGFPYGFGWDERVKLPTSISMASQISSLASTKLFQDGKKFEIIDYDACLMASVEVVSCLVPYADYLIVSPESEPGYGQEYTTWLNAVRENPGMNGFELGKIVVDAFVDFYNNDYYYCDATLSVIDTKNFTDRLLDELIALDDILIKEAKNTGKKNNRYNFYDEIYSLITSYFYGYGNEILYDLGNLAGSLSVPQSEMDNCSAAQINLQRNSYTDTALRILSVLGDCDGSGDDVIYAGASELAVQKSNGYSVRGLDGEFIEADEDGYYSIEPTGLSLYVGNDHTDWAHDFANTVSKVLPYINDEKTKEFLTDRAVAVCYYSIITYIGQVVGWLSDMGEKYVSWRLVTEQTDCDGVDLYRTYIPTLIKDLVKLGEFDSYEKAEDYFSLIVAQQAKEAITNDKIDVKRIVEGDGSSSSYQVTLNNTSSQSVMYLHSSCDIEVSNYMTDEFAEYFEMIYGYDIDDIDYVFPSGVCFKGPSFDGSLDINYFYEGPDDEMSEIYKRIYSSTTTVWDVPEMRSYCFVMYDSEGNEHPAQIIFTDRSQQRAMVPLQLVYDDGECSDAFVSVVYADGNWEVIGVSLSNDDVTARTYTPMDSDRFAGAKFTTAAQFDDRYKKTVYLPISQFCDLDVTKDKWGISFGWKHTDDVEEIGYVYPSYYVEDVYGNTIDITYLFEDADTAANEGDVVYSIDSDKVSVTVGGAVESGREAKPEVSVEFDGKALEKGTDYKVVYDGSVGPGEAYVYIFGVGDYCGIAYEPYMIKCAWHTFETVSETPASCTEDGARSLLCTVCGETLDEVIPATEHKLTHFAAKTATMKEAGNVEYWKCSVCEKVFTDEKAQNEVTPESVTLEYENITGDANGDGKLNAKDVIAIMKYLVGYDADGFYAELSDMNGDGKVNSRDVLLIMRAIVEASGKVMTYSEFMAADIGDDVVIEAYVQDKQSWWNDKANVYLQNERGGYFAYEMVCSETDYEKLVPGTKIRVTGKKAMWPAVDGEIEIGSGCTFEFVEDAEHFIAEPEDVTAIIGTDGLAAKMNRRVIFKGLTVVAQDDGSAFKYKNEEKKSDDLYFKASLGDSAVDFCVEFYLRGSDTDVYKAVEALKVGDRIDVEAYLYWYEGANPHVIAVTPAE